MAKERTPEQQAAMDKMDADAVLAGIELAEIMAASPESDTNTELATAKDIANWWVKWYPKAGHKRLGKLLTKYAG